jgi:hypothetical protein
MELGRQVGSFVDFCKVQDMFHKWDLHQTYSKPRPRKVRKSYPWAGTSLLGISSKAAKQMLEHV